MKLSGLLIGLIMVSSLLVGSLLIMSQTLRISESHSDALTDINNSITMNVSDELNTKLHSLENKTAKIKDEMGTRTDLFSIFQIAPSLLDVFIELSGFMIAIPNGIGNAVSYAFPQVPNWAFTMVSLMIIAIVILKVVFAIRGTGEV